MSTVSITRTLTALALVGLSSGCIVYDDKCPRRGYDDTGYGYDDDGPGTGDNPGDDDDDDGSDGDDGDDGGDDSGDEVVDPVFLLTPDSGKAGSTLILSLEADQEVDFAAVEELIFTGDITICTMSAREDELLVTVAIADSAEAGLVDLIIDSGDEAWLVEDAFEILPVDGGSSGGGSDGGSDGTEDGGDGGSGSSGSGCG